MHRRTLVPSALVLVALLTAAGCTSEGSDPAPERSATTSTAATSSESYVALGDSFTAGPGITPADAASDGCQRSTADYPALVAKAQGVRDLTDVSCVGATTGGLLTTSRNVGGDEVPAQVEAITKDTTWVTVGVGGNDGDVYTNLFRQCGPALDRAADACTGYIRGELPGVLATTGRSVARVLADVERRAPDARVVLVGYPRLFDAKKACDGLPAAPTDLPALASAEKQLDATLAAAARSGDATFVSMYTESAGHDACADAPWTNGIDPETGDGIVLHPTRAGMQATAKAVVAALTS